MNGILETGISLVLVFLIFSIIAYVVQELISVNLKFRGNMLWKSMAQLFDGFNLKGWGKLAGDIDKGQANITDLFYQHPQIQSLMKEKMRLPSYIPAANFALAVMDLIAKQAPAAGQTDFFQKVKDGLTTFKAQNGNLGQIIEDLINTSTDIQDLQTKIENWFNDYMKRVSGWYQSHILLSLRIIAIGLAIGFNLNVIKLSRTIYNNSELRASMVAVAGNLVDHPEIVNGYLNKDFDSRKNNVDTYFSAQLPDSASADSAQKAMTVNKQWSDSVSSLVISYTKESRVQIDTLLRTIKGTGLPIGWSRATFKEDFCGKGWADTALKWFLAILGWLITAGCISMGAPFWFDLLVKLVNLRRSGGKPDESASK